MGARLPRPGRALCVLEDSRRDLEGLALNYRAAARAGFDPQGIDNLPIGRCRASMVCMPARPQKITLGEMRSTGIRGLLIYCADYRCSHSIAINADQ